MPEGAEVEGTNLDDVRVILNLERLGELIAAVAHRMTVLREIEAPDFDGDEMRDLAITGWKHVCMMADREDFKNSVMADLEQLEVPVPEPQPQHRSEFGL